MYATYRDGVCQELVGNIEFSNTVYQPADTLDEAQMLQFGVLIIVDMPRPELAGNEHLCNPTYVVNGTMLERTYSKEVVTTVTVPETVNAIQFRQGLTRMGLRSVVDSTIAAGGQDLKDWYEFSFYFDRHHPMVLEMLPILQASPEQADQLWILCATL